MRIAEVGAKESLVASAGGFDRMHTPLEITQLMARAALLREGFAFNAKSEMRHLAMEGAEGLVREVRESWRSMAEQHVVCGFQNW